MKLRIRGNSIRLRLRPSEVKQLLETRSVREKTQFAGGRLIYQLVTDKHAASPTAQFTDRTISVVLPHPVIEKWAHSSDVSVDATEQLESGQLLRILIEKDFQCLNPRDEEDSDAYPNPKNRQVC
jgi:hypothetical protein